MAQFTPRLERPTKGNKFYNTQSNGGWSTAIKGKPTDPNDDVYNNCFSGDTKIVTRLGVKRLDEIVDQEVEVLSKDGVYRPAIGGYYGVQEMYKVTLNNGESFVCTGNHRWYVRRISSHEDRTYEKFYFKPTVGLNENDYIPYTKNLDTAMDEDGIRHGFIYGDGSYYNGSRHSQANLCGFKIEYMSCYFENARHCNERNGVATYYPYPAEYKKVPDLTENLDYLRGFIAGLIASDGCVDKYGCVTISTVKKDDALRIHDILCVLGYRNKLLIETRDTNYKKNSTLYRLSIRKSFITSDLLLNPKHRDRFNEKLEHSASIAYTRVKSVEKLGYEEDCYCVSEPETHTMTLYGGILTGQCVGHAFGRANEIGYQVLGEEGFKKLFDTYGGKIKDLKLNKQMPLLAPRNAENFYDVAIQQGLEVSKTPTLGAVMCWQKGPTRQSADGAGHVAVVEKIISPTCVQTSESGYGQSTPFWTQYRYKGNDGNWGGGTAYKFLGFIKNPAVSDSSEPYPTPTRVLKEGDNGEDVKWVQWKLKSLAYLNDSIDGWFGVLTLGAVLVFQLKNGLAVDGVVGPATRKALQKV